MEPSSAPSVNTENTSSSSSTLDVIHQRKSVRNFTNQAVSESDLVEVVRAGMAAPTAVNKQPWAFVIVRKRDVLDKLADQLPHAKMLKTAQAAIVVCGDMNKALTGVNQDYWVQDCSAATQNILLAAESLGLGAVWTAAFPYQDRITPVKEALNLPDHITPLNVIPMGYPVGTDTPKDKWKTENVFIENYDTPLIGYEENPFATTINSDTINAPFQTWVSLTVAEGKRLIAKGLLAYPPVKDKLNSGNIIITKGTSNTYIAEEFINENFTSGEYVYGHILPATSKEGVNRERKRSELVLKNGQVQDDVAWVDALKAMNQGDIVFKGANIINYQKGQAAILIGHPTGGTIGHIHPVIASNGIRLIIPVGLEKQTSQDLNVLDAKSRDAYQKVDKSTPKVWSVEGELFTEIEAIKQFANVEVFQIASGGIGGAEGAVSLAIRGNEDEVNKALEIVKSIQGEAPYLEHFVAK